MGKVLIVDDEPSMRRILATNLRMDSHVVVEASGVLEAKAILEREEFDVILTDQRMPDGDGLDVLQASQQDDPTTSVIFLTAVGTLELAVTSMRQGAFDFLTKPFVPDTVRAAVKRACERTALLRENAVLKTAVLKLEGPDQIFGDSPSIQAVRETIARVAPMDTTVLITGETGTGKELVARAIHRNSRRADRPFIAINCASVTETLLESELFGHERGAFTGADKVRAGLFEAAHEGTLFLDEVGELSPAAQAKLLRVLADGEIQRVGSTRTRHVDVRVLAATLRNLKDRVREGLFREDLYYRLAVLPIHLPPLRDRSEDIAGLCNILSASIAQEMKVARRSVSQAAIDKLRQYPFPGNIRELRNLLERAYILGQHGDLQPEDFPLNVANLAAQKEEVHWDVDQLAARLPEHLDLREVLSQIEIALIERALSATGGVQAEAARRLSLSRSDLGYKVAKYALSNR
ncbi:MAG TPA: sigma-54 dependent transcriptional regulator [Acidisarcina sp.]|nr:sigma-54 dependent transcriptional regulator [Acidisarcina sp.]